MYRAFVLFLCVLLGGALSAQADPMSEENFLRLCQRDNVSLQEIESALKTGVNVNAKNKDGKTALMLVAEGRQAAPDIIKALVAAGANINLAVGEKLAEDERAAAADKNLRATMETALHFAAEKAGPEVVSALIQSGADPNALTKDERTPLIIAAWHTKYPEVIDVLLDAGATVNAQDIMGWTPLLHAVCNNEHDALAVTEKLLARNADPNYRSKDERTAIMCAADDEQKIKILQALLAAKADTNIKQKDGTTAFWTLLKTGSDSAAIAELIKGGADVNVKKLNGLTPLLELTCFADKPDLVQMIIEAGADTNVKDNAGRTPFGCAAAVNKNPEVLYAFLKGEANARDKRGDGMEFSIKGFLSPVLLGAFSLAHKITPTPNRGLIFGLAIAEIALGLIAFAVLLGLALGLTRKKD